MLDILVNVAHVVRYIKKARRSLICVLYFIGLGVFLERWDTFILGHVVMYKIRLSPRFIYQLY